MIKGKGETQKGVEFGIPPLRGISVRFETRLCIRVTDTPSFFSWQGTAIVLWSVWYRSGEFWFLQGCDGVAAPSLLGGNDR